MFNSLSKFLIFANNKHLEVGITQTKPNLYKKFTKRERNKRKVKSKVLHPCKYCPVFFEGFCVPHTAGFCLPCFLASMVFCSPKSSLRRRGSLSFLLAAQRNKFGLI